MKLETKERRGIMRALRKAAEGNKERGRRIKEEARKIFAMDLICQTEMLWWQPE